MIFKRNNRKRKKEKKKNRELLEKKKKKKELIDLKLGMTNKRNNRKNLQRR
jgi:hypothetical protein